MQNSCWQAAHLGGRRHLLARPRARANARPMKRTSTSSPENRPSAKNTHTHAHIGMSTGLVVVCGTSTVMTGINPSANPVSKKRLCSGKWQSVAQFLPLIVVTLSCQSLCRRLKSLSVHKCRAEIEVFLFHLWYRLSTVDPVGWGDDILSRWAIKQKTTAMCPCSSTVCQDERVVVPIDEDRHPQT